MYGDVGVALLLALIKSLLLLLLLWIRMLRMICLLLLLWVWLVWMALVLRLLVTSTTRRPSRVHPVAASQGRVAPIVPTPNRAAPPPKHTNSYRMWIIPSPCEVTPFWETLQNSELFVMQRSTTGKPTLWNSVVGTLQALFDVKQAPFRILLRSGTVEGELQPGDQAITVAVGGSRREIDENWAWLESDISQPARLNGDIKDTRVMTYRVCRAVEERVALQAGRTDESTADERFRATARAYRHTFGLPETERLVNCTSGCSPHVISYL